MITIARYSYWELTHYVDRHLYSGMPMGELISAAYKCRPETGPQSWPQLFAEPQIRLQRSGFETFIRPYLLFPWDKESMQDAIASCRHKRLAIHIYIHDDFGNQKPTTEEPWFYWDEMYEVIGSGLNWPRTRDGLPHIAEIRLLML